MVQRHLNRIRDGVNGYPRWVRLSVGILLVLGGILGFLPVLGFWMIPLGLLILSYDLPMVRRWRRKFEVTVLRRWRQRRS